MKHSIEDSGDLRKYYAAIPNIIFTLGLNPYELTLYVYLKKVAGESGVCWKSTATIAKECNMSTGVIPKLKASLCKERTHLNGKPLIVIASAMQNGGNPDHGITITDIWPENMAELERVRQMNATRSLHEGARSRGGGARSSGGATRSRGGIKEDLIKNNPEEELNLKPPSAHALLMDFHNNHLSGPMPDGKAQGAALKWLIDHYSKEALMACYEYQLTQTWRAKVNWMTVKSDIGQWINRNGESNGSYQQNLTEQGSSRNGFEFQPKSRL